MEAENVSTPQAAQRTDRRKKPTNPFSLASLFGSRRTIRRVEDQKTHYYVDRYGLGSGLFFMGALLLSTLDAFITLQLIAAGGQEVNPVMHFLLQFGPYPFLGVKYVTTGIALLFLLIHKEYRWFNGRIRIKSVLAGIVVAYVLLLAWEAYLLVQLLRHH